MSDLLEYKCPCCGGAIEFNSTLQKMKCPYCDTEFDMETVKEFNEAAANQQSDELNWESASDNSWKEDEASGMSVYICQSLSLIHIYCANTDITNPEQSAPFVRLVPP